MVHGFILWIVSFLSNSVCQHQVFFALDILCTHTRFIILHHKNEIEPQYIYQVEKKNENLFEYSIAVAILCANGFYIRLCLFSKVNILKRKFDPYPFVHNAVFFLQNYISFQFKWYDALWIVNIRFCLHENIRCKLLSCNLQYRLNAT